MLYTIVINQLGVTKYGLEKKTDLTDWAIINYLQSWYFAEKKKTMYNTEKNKNYVWINYNHLLENMPILGIKEKPALTYRLQKLKKLGLIDTFQTKDNTLYFDITEYCMQVIAFTENKTEDNKKVNKNENKNNTVQIDTTPCSNEHNRGVQMDITAQLVYQSNSISDNININSLEEQSLEVESKELITSDSLNDKNLDLIISSLPAKKPNLIYSIYLLYIKNWTKRYKGLKEPILTKKMAGQIKLLLRDIQNIDEIDKMLEAFINCDEGYLIGKTHGFGLFLCDLNKWRALMDKPELAKIFTTEYAKNKMYLQKKELVQKEEEQKNIEKIRQEKIQMEIHKQEREKKQQEEKELLRKQKEEIERQRKEEEERLAESFRKHLKGE